MTEEIEKDIENFKIIISEKTSSFMISKKYINLNKAGLFEDSFF